MHEREQHVTKQRLWKQYLLLQHLLTSLSHLNVPLALVRLCINLVHRASVSALSELALHRMQHPCCPES